VQPVSGRHRDVPAGLDGVERGLDPGEPNSANLYEMHPEERDRAGIELLPANLLDAVRELEKNDVLRRALGKTPREDYVDYFVKVKLREWQAAHEHITQWELDRYLQLF
jgi:glutamine synthetase